MPYDKKMMVDYVHLANLQKIRLGDKRVVEALEKGKSWLDIEPGDEYKPAEFVDVLFVPDLAKNIFSVTVVAKRGYPAEFKQSGCVILDKLGTVLGSGKMQHHLYVLGVSERNVEFHDVNVAKNDMGS